VEKIRVIANCDANILISGETGTGKELCARAIHYYSSRVQKSFVPVNCGALPTELVENELFGHKRGAYTGAATAELGLIQEADGGTLFLDEIDCLPANAQVKLLRFLQEKEYRPLGSAKLRRADTRVIAATNLDLHDAVRSGRLRQDLYYRLNVIPVALPPLRERRGDVPLLARHFLGKYNAEFSKEITDFTERAVEKLVGYDWPGNVRELEHVVERAVALAPRPRIEETDLVMPNGTHPQPGQETFREAKTKLIRQFEKNYLQELLYANNGNVSKAARAAQKNRRALWQLICKHQIDVRQFRTVAK
jgi:DNA-binding NtrC family response regulator